MPQQRLCLPLLVRCMYCSTSPQSQTQSNIASYSMAKTTDIQPVSVHINTILSMTNITLNISHRTIDLGSYNKAN